MEPDLKKLVSIFTLALITTVGSAQTNEIKVRYIGNCGLHLSDGVSNIYTDFPYRSGAYHYAEYDRSEVDNIQENSILLFTHKHGDHHSTKLLKEVVKTKKGQKFGPWNASDLGMISSNIPDIKIEAFRTKHFLSFKHYSYLITWHGKRIFLSGDTEHPETIGKIKDMDWAFMPAWLFATVMVEQKVKLDTEMIGIYHIGPRDDIEIIGPTVLMLKKQGEVISIPY